MAVHKHPKGYRLRVRNRGGHEVERILDVKKLNDARLIEAWVRLQMNAGVPQNDIRSTLRSAKRYLGSSKGLTLGAAHALAMESAWLNAKSRANYYGTTGRVTVMKFGPDLVMAQIGKKHIANFIRKCISDGDCSSTINHRLAILRKLWELAMEYWEIEGVGYIEWSRYRMKIQRRGRIREISKEEEKQMIHLLETGALQGSQIMAKMVYMALYTGLRSGELRALTPADYQAELQRIHVKRSLGSGTTKTGVDRYIPVRGKTLSILLDLIEETNREGRTRLFEELSKWSIIRLWRYLKDKMALQDDKEFVFHCLRHTCASRLLRSGADIRVVQAWLGHTDIKTTQIYLHLNTKDLDAAAEKFMADDK